MYSSYISLTDFKTIYAPELDYGAITDATISGMISAASRWIDRFTSMPRGWDLETLTSEEYSSLEVHTDSDGNLYIPLKKRPLYNGDVNSVSQLTIALGAFTTNLTLTSNGNSVLSSPSPNWSIIYPNTFLIATGTLLTNQRLYSLRSYHYFVRLNYLAGYQNIPDDMKMACALLTRQFIAQRYNPTGAFSLRQGSLSMEFAQRGSRGETPLPPLVDEAQLLLNPYVRVA